MQWLGLISIMAAAAYVSMMALYYARIYANGVSLENEAVNRLAATRETIARTEKAGAARAAFLASMSHELRTPLNAVIGYSSMLIEEAEDEGDEDSADDLQRIRRAGEYLLRLVNGILDLARLEAGKVELCLERADIARLVKTVVDENRSAAEEHGLHLATSGLDVREELAIDKVQFHRILDTLLKNAVHQASAKTIDVAFQIRDGRITVSVRDDGLGIAAADRERIFEGFSMESEATAGQYGGAGLSLAVAQRVCGLMGGEIRLESALGDGACFIVDIPVCRSARPPAVEQPYRTPVAMPITAEAA